MTTAEGVSLTPEYSSAKRDYELLRESLVKQEEEKTYLLYQVVPELEAIYLAKVGKLKYELLGNLLEAYRLRRKLELIQSCINRQSEIVLEAIDILLEKELQEQRKKLEQESKRLEAALKYIELPPLGTDEAQELRILYYKLARKLHPDLNPEQSETMKMRWLRVTAAYQQGDLNQMRLLEVLAQEEIAPDSMPTALEELKRRNDLLSTRIKQLMSEIDHIKSNFPYSDREQLNDPAWVDRENNETLNAISKALGEIAAYEEAIEKLLKSAGL